MNSEKTKEKYVKFLEMFNNGMSTKEIADVSGYKKSSIERIIKSYDDEILKNSREEVLKRRNEEILRLYKSGLSKKKIFKMMHVCPGTVDKVLDDYGVDHRFSMTTPKITKIRSDVVVVEVPRVSEKVMVIENGRYVERVRLFRDITELCGKQKIYMERIKVQ